MVNGVQCLLGSFDMGRVVWRLGSKKSLRGWLIMRIDLKGGERGSEAEIPNS